MLRAFLQKNTFDLKNIFVVLKMLYKLNSFSESKNKLIKVAIFIKRSWTEVHVRIISQGDNAWLCADKSAGMRVGEE